MVMAEMNEKLIHRFTSQHDGMLLEDEEMRLRLFAQTYALCEHAIAVLNNLRTSQCYIYFGQTAEQLGIGRTGTYVHVDSVFEEQVISCIHPDDLVRCNLQELHFFNTMQSPGNQSASFPWYMEQLMRMHDAEGRWQWVSHRIHYFPSEGKRGICYALCVYKFTQKTFAHALLVNKLTGEERKVEVGDLKRLLTDHERDILKMIQHGLASKEVADQLGISKHTVDRHRQNIIQKLQVSNTTEAIYKAKTLGLIE